MYLTNISAWTKINVCSKHPNNGKFHVLCIYNELNSFSYANIFLQSYPLLIVMMVHTKAWSQLLKKGRLEISWVVMVIHQKEHLLHRGRPLPLFLNASVPPRHSDCLRWSSWIMTFLTPYMLSSRIWFWSTCSCGCCLAIISKEGVGFLEVLPLPLCCLVVPSLSQVGLSWWEICGSHLEIMSVCCWRYVDKDFRHHFCRRTRWESWWSSISTGSRYIVKVVNLRNFDSGKFHACVLSSLSLSFSTHTHMHT